MRSRHPAAFNRFGDIAVSDRLLILSGSEVRPNAHEPKWFKDCVVEASGKLDVEGAERDMVKH
jgi:hypothetical protein